MDSTVERITDYGFGSYHGSPLVLMPQMGACYHRHDHGGQVIGTAFTEDFLRNGMGLRPCRVCWPTRDPSC